METKTTSVRVIYKEKGQNEFRLHEGEAREGEELAAEWQRKQIIKAYEDCNYEGNIPTRWELWTLPFDVPEDEYVEVYARDLMPGVIQRGMAENGMSKYALSQRSGVSISQITRFLDGETDLSLDSFVRLVSAMGKFNKLLNLFEVQDVKGIFTQAEWKALAASLNGTLIDDTVRYSTEMLIAHNEDAEKYEHSFSQFEVEVDQLNNKIKSLKESQIGSIYERVEEFWESQGENPIDLEEWSKF